MESTSTARRDTALATLRRWRVAIALGGTAAVGVTAGVAAATIPGSARGAGLPGGTQPAVDARIDPGAGALAQEGDAATVPGAAQPGLGGSAPSFTQQLFGRGPGGTGHATTGGS